MKKRLPVALIVEGNATQSALLLSRPVAEEIGPVKSSLIRIAKRHSNSLRAGYPVAAYEDLQKSRLVLLRAPDETLPRIIEEICASTLDLAAMSFVLCDSWQTSAALSHLRDAGASVATALPVAGPGAQWFVAEGDRGALRQLKLLLDSAGLRLVSLRAGMKDVYFAAELLATSSPLPLLAGARSALREAGVSGKILEQVLDRFMAKLVRNFRAGSRLSAVDLDAPPEIVRDFLSGVQDKAPSTAALIEASATLKSRDAEALSMEVEEPRDRARRTYAAHGSVERDPGFVL